MNTIHKMELKKAKFLAEYRKICEKYGMMVVMMEDEEEDFFSFHAAEVDEADLDRSILEMLINKTLTTNH